jgi:hypothetical protein
MRAKKNAFEFPGLRETGKTIATIKSPHPFSGKIKSMVEFDNSTTQQPLTNEKIIENSSSVRNGTLKGLCGNCEFVESCIYSKPVTGIWHCNEYQ